MFSKIENCVELKKAVWGKNGILDEAQPSDGPVDRAETVERGRGMKDLALAFDWKVWVA